MLCIINVTCHVVTHLNDDAQFPESAKTVTGAPSFISIACGFFTPCYLSHTIKKTSLNSFYDMAPQKKEELLLEKLLVKKLLNDSAIHILLSKRN